MAYRLSIADHVPTGARACAREQLDGAVEQLAHADADPVEAVHEARKHLKKARALLRLVRPGMPRQVYRGENAALREAGAALSAARDADVVVETVDKLAERFAGRLPADTFAQLRDAVARAATDPDGAGGDPAPDLDAVLEALRAASVRVEQWPLERCDWETVVSGIATAYKRGRAAFAVARGDPTAVNLHAWRKRAKDLWYHERLLTPVWPAVLAAHAEEVHVLTELLGDDHDLAVLEQRLDGGVALAPAADADRAAILALVDERRAELRADATGLGRRVYAESPKAFAARTARWVRAARNR